MIWAPQWELKGIVWPLLIVCLNGGGRSLRDAPTLGCNLSVESGHTGARGEDGPIHRARHARMFLLLVSPGFGRPAPQTGV